MSSWVQPGVMQVGDEDSGERKCRFCHEFGGHDLIAPCACRGSIKWVHRTCLDHWRAVSPNPDSFSKCDTCNTKFKVIMREENQTCLKMKFAALVSRDIFLVILLINLVVVGLGFLADLIIPTEKFVRQLAGVGAVLMEYRVLRVYSFGGIVFFLFMGIAGIIFSFYKCCCAASADEAEAAVSASSYAGYRSSSYDCYFVYCGPYYNPTYGYYYGPWGSWSCDCCICCDCSGGCGDCSHGGGNCGDCSGSSGGNGDCKCDSGGEGMAVLLVIGLIILAVIILIGLFFGVFLFTLIASKIVNRHIHVLNRSHRAKIFYVADLSDPSEASIAVDQNDDRAEDVVPLLSGGNNADNDSEPTRAIRMPTRKKIEDDEEDNIYSVV